MTDRDDPLKLITEPVAVRGLATVPKRREADQCVDLCRVAPHHAGAPLVRRVHWVPVDDLQFDVAGGLTRVQRTDGRRHASHDGG